MKKKPTGKTARGQAKPEKRATAKTDNAKNVAKRILSLWYHCAEVKYHIPNDRRFDFEYLFRQEGARFKDEGIGKADIARGYQMALADFKELDATHAEQVAKWERYLNDLRDLSSGATDEEYQKAFATFMDLEAMPTDYRESVVGFAHKQNETLHERAARWRKQFELSAIAQCELIDQIKEPDALSPIWFMDKVYRDLASKLKVALKLRQAKTVNVWLIEKHAEQDRQYEKANPDLVKIAEARRHGIRVKLSGASYENALRFWDEMGHIAHEGFAKFPQDLTSGELDEEATKRIALIEAEIDKVQKRFAEDSRHIPESSDFERALDYAIKRAGAEGTTARAMARSAAHILSEAATLRGEELRKHQRERAAELVLQDGLEIGRAALEYGNELVEEAKRGGYKNPESLEQGMRRHATELGIADKISKGKRGKHKTA